MQKIVATLIVFIFTAFWANIELCAAKDLPIIDAHSQATPETSADEIAGILDKAGVSHVILSARGGLKGWEIANYVKQYPDYITGAVTSKGRAFNKNNDKFYKNLKKQLKKPEFGAMAEAILYHGQKGNKAKEVTVPINSPQVEHLLKKSIEKSWPFILHIEFRKYRTQAENILFHLDKMLMANSSHPFVLIHMGQLEAGQVRKFIRMYPNLYFMTSHCEQKSGSNRAGWTVMLTGSKIKKEWKQLLVDHPDRFILAFDANWPKEWRKEYKSLVQTWRTALRELPSSVAHKVAHENAERLWRISVTK